jgi:hypothetical protein
MSIGQVFHWPNVFWTRISLAKYLLARQCVSQMYFSQTMCQPNVF